MAKHQKIFQTLAIFILSHLGKILIDFKGGYHIEKENVFRNDDGDFDAACTNGVWR